MAFSKRALFFTIATISRRFSSHCSSTSKKLPKLRCINKIQHKYKSMAIEESQKVLREYFHSTRSLPFAFSELIAVNAPFSLSNLTKKVSFSTVTFSASLRKLLRYEPINEFEFFLESIGIEYNHVPRYLPKNKFFFSEDCTALNAAISLSRFGFPWNTLGKLYEEEVLIFSKSSDELSDRLSLFRERYEVDNLTLVGICLAFPHLLSLEGDLSCDVDDLFSDLKRVFVEFGKGSCVEGNVDSWYEVCCKVKNFYDLGCKKGKVSELMCEKKEFFVDCSNETLVQKMKYFSKFGVAKADVGSLLLQSPEILNLDLEKPVISVLRLLEHFGLEKSDIDGVSQKYPNVLGRNELANLPQVMKACDLHEWCFDRIKSSNGELLIRCAIKSSPDEGVDREFVEAMKTIEFSRKARHTITKVDFLKGIGFSENALFVKVLSKLQGNSGDLAERFDFLLHSGIKHSDLCLIIKSNPKLLSQDTKQIEQKLHFFREEMKCSLEYLIGFAKYLSYDLENRIKRRYRCYVWLRENLLLTKDYSVASLITFSEKEFVKFLFEVHPTVPKHYFERF